MKALVLDFDGVISDSAPEAFLVALTTYVDLRPNSPHEDILTRIHETQRITVEELRNELLYLQFLELMPLGNRAEDYGVLLSLLERKLSVHEQSAYDRARNAEDKVFLRRFHERFYQIRHEFLDSNPEGWYQLIGSFPTFIDVLRRRANDAVLAIATAKDRKSVETLLQSFGIADLFPDDQILDKETGVRKVAHIKQLQNLLDIPFPEITFMDDKVNHLDSVASLGICCALAAWGYNGPREHNLARNRGYLVCSLDDVERQLFN